MQDGEVPVTVVNPRPRQGIDALGPPRPGISPQERAEAAEAAMARELMLREQAERRAQEAEAHLLEARTKLGHADLARNEAEAQLTEARAELARLRAERDEAVGRLELRSARRDARARLLARDPDAPPPRRGRPPKPVDPNAPPRRRGRPPKAVTPGVAASPADPAAASRKRGRPRKDKLAPLVAIAAKPVKWWLRDTAAAEPSGPRRGRKRKA